MNASEYYDTHPLDEHRAGDVWLNLPTFGMLPVDHAAGIVITPACDLQNRKSSSITYLPILPVRIAFCLPPLCHEIARGFNGQLAAVGLQTNSIDVQQAAVLAEAQLKAIEDKLLGIESAGCGGKEQASIARLRGAIDFFRIVSSGNFGNARLDSVKIALGEKLFEELSGRLITNAARPDLHFLPDDRQRVEWSAVSEHSVVLFRFPMSAPSEVFDRAQDLAVKDWSQSVENLKYLGSGLSRFAQLRPAKRATVRQRYMADMLTRYVGMIIRLGSPDFPEETIAAYKTELKGGR